MGFIELEQLNQAQQQAVSHDLGNLLVLAGAGSGKTRVLVNRVAWLLSNGTDPSHIMVVTFTNKAAKEMSSRLNQIKLTNINHAWIGTFHGLSHKFLRLHYNLAGLEHNFEVIDPEDQLKILRGLIKQLKLNEDLFEPKKVQNFINRQKDHGNRSHNLPTLHTKYDRIMFELYSKYENICKELCSIDFAELLLRTYELLRDNQELLLHYQARFKHFFIDEFQDTNPIQYNFLKLLSTQASSITAVGDDDQSIYSWRGAKVENIVKYTKEFTNVRVIRLEKNYRSTKTILAAANSIINHNYDRMGKTLWTDGNQGEKIKIYGAFNEDDEAFFIIKEIQAYLKQGKNYEDIAILYRSNAQSRAIEEALVKYGINYLVYGGVSFFERTEIKDLLAYLRLAINGSDNLAFERIINTPVRGIGDKTIEQIRSVSIAENLGYLDATRLIIAEHPSQTLINKLTGFVTIISKIQEYIADHSLNLSEIIARSIEASGLLGSLNTQKDVNSINRVENLQELVNATLVFESSINYPEFDNSLNNEHAASKNLKKIQALLDYAALEGKEHHLGGSDHKTNQADGTVHQGHVKLMTLHAAKGLEFPIVFLCGLEEGLFPHYFSKDNPEALSEERRLCYVGITRAMERVFISYAKKRKLFGREEYRSPSRFLEEIPKNLMESIEAGGMLLSRSKYIDQRDPKKFFTQNKPQVQVMVKANNNNHKDHAVKKVRHAKFGIGTIVDQDGQGEHTRLHIDFGSPHGLKWLLLSYANLEVLN